MDYKPGSFPKVPIFSQNASVRHPQIFYISGVTRYVVMNVHRSSLFNGSQIRKDSQMALFEPV